jgi:DNA polymerase/3'-5' exonuclease PolX
MTDPPKRQWDAGLARAVANGLVELLEPYCLAGMLCAAGSLRRGRATVGDVEICYVSRTGPVRKPGEMFESPCLLADAFIQHLLGGKLEPRVSRDGITTWGDKNKLALHKATGLPVDLFREPDAADWWRTLVIRTGPKDLNLRLIAGAERQGLRLHAYGPGFTRRETGEIVPCRSERKVFELCGLEYLEPQERK